MSKPNSERNARNNTLSADDSYWAWIDRQAAAINGNRSYVFRCMIEYMIDYELIRDPDAIFPEWRKRGGGI